MLKKMIKRGLQAARRISEDNPHREKGDRNGGKPQFVYGSLNSLHTKILQEDPARIRPAYLWGALHGAHLAKALGINSVSLVEFGVASGNGLVSLEIIAGHIERNLDVGVSVYGFDTGAGLPPPQDVRDCPNLFANGDYSMDIKKLHSRLNRAKLILGRVEETLPEAIASGNLDPVAFISFDLDFYSSTKHALSILEADKSILLPRVHCYFDDITGFTYSDYNGERLAIAEFNQNHEFRKISPIYALRHYVPSRFANALWTEKYFMAHILDHDLYSRPDGLTKQATADLLGFIALSMSLLLAA